MKNNIKILFTIILTTLLVSSCLSSKKQSNDPGNERAECTNPQMCGGNSQQSPTGDLTGDDNYNDGSSDDNSDPSVNFQVVEEQVQPSAGGEIHPDVTESNPIQVVFSKTLDDTQEIIQSGTSLDFVQLKNESGDIIPIVVYISGRTLMIIPAFSLEGQGARYNLSVSTDITAKDGSYLSAPFYTHFYTDKNVGSNSGNNIVFSWARENSSYDPNTKSYYYYEDAGYDYTEYKIHYDTMSHPNVGGTFLKSPYQKLKEVSLTTGDVTIDYELKKYFYEFDEPLATNTEYFFSLQVCSDTTGLCSAHSNEVSKLIQ